MLWISWGLALAGAFLATKLSVKGDLSQLLPPEAPSVVQLHRLENRTRVLADYMIGVEANSPTIRVAAFGDLVARVNEMDRLLVAGTVVDQRALHAYFWRNRYLFADLIDLTSACGALQNELDQLSPWSLHLDEQPELPAATQDAFESLRIKFARLSKELNDPGEFISRDGQLQMMIVRTTFTSDDTVRGPRLTKLLQNAATAVERAFPGVKVGMTGDVINAGAERNALLSGMLLSILITVALVLTALFVFYRSLVVVGALGWSLTVAVLLTFAFAKIAIGHLNMASAFLSSIVIGNGINFGLIVTARFMEMMPASGANESTIALAAIRSAPGTLTAAATAAVAYGSLAFTQFRGFRDFGLIGAIGMLLCWLSAFTLLPAALQVSCRHVRALEVQWLERALACVAPRREGAVLIAGTAAFVISGLTSAFYLLHDPFEDDLRNLSSDTTALGESSRWMHKFDSAFGNGLSGGFAIGVDRRSEARDVVTKLRRIDAGRPAANRSFSNISSIDDFLPTEQKAKLTALAEIRRLLDSPMWNHVSAGQRQEIRELRPPDELRPLSDADVPEPAAFPYTERDGTRGRLILANTGLGVNTWSLRSLQHFAKQVRSAALGPHVIVGGTAFVFSDMFDSMRSDGTRASAFALLGSVGIVMLLLGPGRFGGVTLACAALGILTMLSVTFALGIKVNFLDFVALPITVGIGVDYAVNIAARARQSTSSRPGHDAVRRTGPVVALCSYTTVVGYGALLFSPNRGIRSFGLSAIIGELTCLVAALIIAPVFLDWERSLGRHG